MMQAGKPPATVKSGKPPDKMNKSLKIHSDFEAFLYGYQWNLSGTGS